MSREFRTAQQQVKKMTRAKARSEGKFADEDVTSQIVDEKTALKKKLNKCVARTKLRIGIRNVERKRHNKGRRCEDLTTIFKSRQVTECEISKSARSLNTP